MKTRFLLGGAIGFFVFFPVSAYATIISHDTGSCSTGASGGVTSAACSLTMANAGAIVTECMGNFPSSATSFTANDGNAMTAFPSTSGYDGGSSSLRQVYYFYDTNVPSGTINVTVTAGVAGFMDCDSQGYDGVSNEAPAQTDSGQQVTGNALFTDSWSTSNSTWGIFAEAPRCTSAAGNLVAAVGSVFDSNGATAGSVTGGCSNGGDIGLNEIGAEFLAATTSGGGGGGGSATSTQEGTSTPSQIQTDWIATVYLYFGMVVFIIWLLRKRN